MNNCSKDLQMTIERWSNTMNDCVFVTVGVRRCGGVREGLTVLMIFEYILKEEKECLD